MNKHLLFVILLLLVVSSVFAQPGMQGMRISSNGGTISGLENPALLANVKNRWDVSLFGLNYTIENSDLKINWRDIMNGEELKFNAASFKNIDNFSLSNVVEIQGPSAMFSLKNKLAVGFTTRVRSFTQLRSLNFSFASPILEGRDFNIATDGKIVEPYMNINLQSFADIGVSGAYKVLRIKKHNLFVGATARMYKGIFALDFTGENINMDLNQY